ncbi:MAG: hypothetical protein II393_04155 [Cytophagales bacterium]|nr:hypothetical protein [Cytophagales bacterium]
MEKREIVIFNKDNKVIFVNNVLNYYVFAKANSLVINTETNEHKFDINNITQVIVNVLQDKAVINSDFILLP